MARPRTIPDAQVYAAIRRLLAEGGDKAVAFAAVARATGLAAPTLVQRYGARERMIRAALADHWDICLAHLVQAEQTAKGAAGFLRLLGDQTDPAMLAATLRDPTLRDLATGWRQAAEAALARLLGGGARAREGAQILFAAWHGQTLWPDAPDKTLKLKDIVKRLA